MPKISRFFGYWIKKHCFIPKNSICTQYRYMQNELSSLAAGLPLSPSPGAGRQLPQSSLETAWSCTQHPVCIPIKEGFSMLQIKKALDLQGLQRRRWDSNPRALSDNSISSRARYDRFDTSPFNNYLVFGANNMISSRARYDHFDTSP